jgi:hypothetical protein
MMSYLTDYMAPKEVSCSLNLSAFLSARAPLSHPQSATLQLLLIEIEPAMDIDRDLFVAK